MAHSTPGLNIFKNKKRSLNMERYPTISSLHFQEITATEALFNVGKISIELNKNIQCTQSAKNQIASKSVDYFYKF